MLTKEQILARTKTVTRRLGWWFLKPGDVVWACEKCMGLKKGEKSALCLRKRNQPRVFVLICEKCRYRAKCPSYQQYINPELFEVK